MRMSDEEIFKIKTLALLHDPPWKPWSITRSIKGKNGEMREKSTGRDSTRVRSRIL